MAGCKDESRAGQSRKPALAALLLVAACAEQQGPHIVLRDAWARETAPAQKSAAVYLTIANKGGRTDRLVHAATPAAAAASLHSSSSSGGVARMRPIPNGIEIPPGSAIELEPGATHLMLTELKRPLRVGETFDLRFGFERSGRRSLAVRVVPAAEDGHSQHGPSR